jgi:hypothetical protein
MSPKMIITDKVSYSSSFTTPQLTVSGILKIDNGVEVNMSGNP